MSAHIELRRLGLDEVGTLVDWARAEGWNPGGRDAEAFHATDPDGFIGCFVDGLFAAGIAAIAYGEDFGFIGLYISRPDFRGKGYGIKVWNAGMARLKGRTVGLDGVPEQQANYVSMGFRTAYRTARWSGKVTATRPAGIRAVTAEMAERVKRFDRRFFPAPRDAFLSAWLSPPHHALVSLDGERVAGYAVCRACADGYKLGPLFAETFEVARDLLSGCADLCGDGELHLDVPDDQAAFTGLLASFGFTRGFETARMYLGPPPLIDMDGVFAITTLELG